MLLANVTQELGSAAKPAPRRAGRTIAATIAVRSEPAQQIIHLGNDEMSLSPVSNGSVGLLPILLICRAFIRFRANEAHSLESR
jgi:hypothetical protein